MIWLVCHLVCHGTLVVVGFVWTILDGSPAAHGDAVSTACRGVAGLSHRRSCSSGIGFNNSLVCCQVGNCRSSKNRNRSVWLRPSRCQMMPLSRCVRKCCVALVPKYWFWRQIFLMPASNTVVRYCCCLGHPSGRGSSSPAAAGTGPRCGLGLLFPSGRP